MMQCPEVIPQLIQVNDQPPKNLTSLQAPRLSLL